MNANQLTECMDFMTSAKEDTASRFGESSGVALTACQFVPQSMTEFYVCMVG